MATTGAMMSEAKEIKQWMMIGGGLALLLYIWKNGGLSGAAASAAQGLVNTAGGAITGTVTGVSDQLGIPTPAQTSTDPSVVRYIIDYPDITGTDKGGQLAASQWGSALAYARANMMPAGSGVAPQPGTAVYAAFPPPPNTGGASGGW